MSRVRVARRALPLEKEQLLRYISEPRAAPGSLLGVLLPLSSGGGTGAYIPLRQTARVGQCLSLAHYPSVSLCAYLISFYPGAPFAPLAVCCAFFPSHFGSFSGTPLCPRLESSVHMCIFLFVTAHNEACIVVASDAWVRSNFVKLLEGQCVCARGFAVNGSGGFFFLSCFGEHSFGDACKGLVL